MRERERERGLFLFAGSRIQFKLFFNSYIQTVYIFAFFIVFFFILIYFSSSSLFNYNIRLR